MDWQLVATYVTVKSTDIFAVHSRITPGLLPAKMLEILILYLNTCLWSLTYKKSGFKGEVKNIILIVWLKEFLKYFRLKVVINTILGQKQKSA